MTTSSRSVLYKQWGIIVDCMSTVIGSKMTSWAIINATRTVELFTCDLNGLVFDGSQEPILKSEQYQYKKDRIAACL